MAGGLPNHDWMSRSLLLLAQVSAQPGNVVVELA